jgi:hypothetical protein
MNKILLAIFLFTLFSCEKINLSDLRGFNGFVQIKVDNLLTPIHPISTPLNFEIKQSLSFINLVNNNKKVKFSKDEIKSFVLDLLIIDTLGNTLKIDEDFIVKQKVTYFNGTDIYPVFNTDTEIFESTFQIIFLKKGVYALYSSNPSLYLNRDNFLFREKRITVDFDLKSRQIDLGKQYFSKSFYNINNLSDNPKDRKNTTGEGRFFVKIE